jgi:fermentation-respiration switch protein FrsA (DUF1100 family)
MYKLAEPGYGVFLPEYRGYGGNKGHPSEKGLYADARSALLYLHQQGIPYSKMVIFGESIGAAVTLQMAQEFKVAGVILQSPFKSMKMMAKLHYPWMVLPPWDKFDNERKIKELELPVLIIHGNNDKFVPYSHGRDLYYEAKQSKTRQFKSIKGKDQNIPWNDDYLLSVQDFIDKAIQ